MFLFVDDSPLVLQGPQPTIPPAWLASYWGVIACAAAIVTTLILLEVYRRRRQYGPLTNAGLSFERALTQVTSMKGPAAAAAVSDALRSYLANTDAQLSAGLSTEELAKRLQGLPVYLPANAPLLVALQMADMAKFAGAEASPNLLISEAQEAVRRIEIARRTFASPAPPRP